MKISEKLDQSIDFLADARSELKEGKVVILEGFQNNVRDICEDIAALPKEEMLSYQAKLSELSDLLKILEKELRDQQTSVQQEIFSLNRKQKALKTYETVSHSHKPDPGRDKKDEPQ